MTIPLRLEDTAKYSLALENLGVRFGVTEAFALAERLRYRASSAENQSDCDVVEHL